MPRPQELGLLGSVNDGGPAKGQQGFCYRDDGAWRVALLGVLVGCGIGVGLTLAV